MSYKALPDALHIGDSQVAGQGIFATEDIPYDTELGLSHILLEESKKATIQWRLFNFSTMELLTLINSEVSISFHTMF